MWQCVDHAWGVFFLGIITGMLPCSVFRMWKRGEV
jgi:sulfite exporter TauE/SafE